MGYSCIEMLVEKYERKLELHQLHNLLILWKYAWHEIKLVTCRPVCDDPGLIASKSRILL